MLSYSAVKHAHLLFVVITILLFQYRFLLRALNKSIPKILKIVPHINDTLLLISAITLAVMGGFNPTNHPWLLAKIIALVVYIVLAAMALKSRGTKRIVTYVLATLVFVFMVMTALSKTPYMIG